MSIFAYWSQLRPGETVHPEDITELDRGPHGFQLDLPPGHFSGPLRTAPVVICYGNPGYDDDDRRAAQDPAKWSLTRRIALLGDCRALLRRDAIFILISFPALVAERSSW